MWQFDDSKLRDLLRRSQELFQQLERLKRQAGQLHRQATVMKHPRCPVCGDYCIAILHTHLESEMANPFSREAFRCLKGIPGFDQSRI